MPEPDAGAGRDGRADTVGADDVEVLAAGGIVTRRGARGTEVLLVHRPRYDDWSFPKGKLDPGESLEEAARREVYEETGLRCRTGDRLAEQRYVDHKGREKSVTYWAMRDPEGEFRANDEVDEIRWVDLDAAGAHLTYRRDAEMLREVVERLAP